MIKVDHLRTLRHTVSALLGHGSAALFALRAAVFVRRSLASFAALSLAPVFRRRWSSLDEAVPDSQAPRSRLLALYVEQRPQAERVVLAGAHTAWSRLAAVTLRAGTDEHQASPLSGRKPVTLGQGYSTLAWIPEAQGRWALPLLHERITRAASPLEQAAKHLRQGCQQLMPRPLSLGDASDGCAPLLKQTADLACAKLLRLRSHRVLYGAPPADAGTGRPRCHGAKFKLNEATTWWPPAADIEGEAAKLGRLRLRLGRTLQLRPAALHP